MPDKYVAVCTGDRHWRAGDVVLNVFLGLLEKHEPSDITIIHGACQGLDETVDLVARELGMHVKPYPYLGQYGTAGGPIRNRQMFRENPDVLEVLSFHDSIATSRGTSDCLRAARETGRPITAHLYRSDGTEQAIPEAVYEKKSTKKRVVK